MSQISYRANLSAAIFPLSLSAAGRTVIVPGPDNNYDRRVDPEGEQKDAGIPQAIYLENVIPTANGYQSVGKNEAFGLHFPAGIPWVVNQLSIADADGIVYKCSLVYTDSPQQYWFSIVGAGVWQVPIFSGVITYPTINPRITSAIVRGVTYVLICGIGAPSTQLYTADLSFSNLVLTNITGSVTHLVMANIFAICGANNYLLAFERSGATHWSSTTTPTDFIPSNVTGAGEIIPDGLQGQFNYAHKTHFGFYLFSRVGAVAATYTGNSRYPWKFLPVSDTNLILSAATQDSNSYKIFACDIAYNIYYLEDTRAVQVAPELSSYLRNNRKDYTYDYTTDTLVPFQTAALIYPQLYCFYDRYICVSVGGTTVGGAQRYKILLVYDMALKRYGRLVFTHTTALEISDINTGQSTFGVMDGVTGAVCSFDLNPFDQFNSGVTTDQSIVILGKFQYVRSRRLELDHIIFDGQFGNVQCKTYSSNDGKELSSGMNVYPVRNNDDTQQYNCRVEGQNISVGLRGKFCLDSTELVFHLGGDR